MSGLVKLLAAMSPTVGPITEQYDGLEYKWKMFVIRPAYFRTEAIAFGILGAYILWFLLGQYVNGARAAST